MVFLIHARHGIENEDLKIAILFETLIFKSYFQCIHYQDVNPPPPLFFIPLLLYYDVAILPKMSLWGMIGFEHMKDYLHTNLFR